MPTRMIRMAHDMNRLMSERNGMMSYQDLMKDPMLKQHAEMMQQNMDSLSGLAPWNSVPQGQWPIGEH